MTEVLCDKNILLHDTVISSGVIVTFGVLSSTRWPDTILLFGVCVCVCKTVCVYPQCRYMCLFVTR